MKLVRQLKYLSQDAIYFYFLLDNLLLVFLIGFFTYRTFFVGRLNLALLVLLLSLFMIIGCRFVAQFRENATTTWLYRTMVVSSVGLMLAAICIQAVRFIYVFAPGLEEPTFSKIMVRMGIATATFYVFALVIAFLYYLYAHGMTRLIWNSYVDRLLQTTFSPNRRQNWRQIRFSNTILFNTFVWGGLASVVTLSVGLVSWWLR
jgi:hypothetical protein